MSHRNPTFLSARARFTAARIAAEHRPYFKLFSRCATFAEELLDVLRIKDGEWQKFVSALLLARLLESSQAGALLCRIGLERDAAASLRIVFETFVYLVCCCEEPQLAFEVFDQLRMANSNLKRSDLQPEMRRRLSKREPELKLEVARIGAEKLKLEQIADRVGLGSEYSTIFRCTSPSVHSSPQALRSLIRGKRGDATGIKYGRPSGVYAAVHLFALSEYLIRATKWVATLCGEDVEARSRRLYSQLRRLDTDWPQEPE